MNDLLIEARRNIARMASTRRRLMYEWIAKRDYCINSADDNSIDFRTAQHSVTWWSSSYYAMRTAWKELWEMTR